MEWDETKHPRDDRGRFNGNGTEYRQNESYDKIVAQGNERQRGNENAAAGVVEEKSPSIDELLGEEFKGYKGQRAVDKLMQEKRGHVKGAFHRDDIGDIDLLWGNDSLGLQHIVKQRDGEKEGHAQEIMEHLSVAIEKGEFKQKNDRGNFIFAYKEDSVQYRTVIAPEYHKNKITYVLTAFRRGKRR